METEDADVLGEVSAAIGEASGEFLSAQTIQDMLLVLTSMAASLVPAAIGAGLTLVDGNGEYLTTASTVPLVAEADDLQYGFDDGPCLAAWSTGVLVRIDDLESDDRWSQWSELALPLGIRAVLSVPLPAELGAAEPSRRASRPSGTLKVYANRTFAFDSRTEAVLTQLAEHAARMLASLRATQGPLKVPLNLHAALARSRTVALAQGMLMERDGTDAAEALRSLVESARAHDWSVFEEANAIASGRR
ncbi:MAG TPA: GAF and ANTAR domain-containing protein [Propionibacteriaceae bacterium]|nr:GAF and ANTAR domain-containing protein [Propionibacteriaceae bacterium]